MLDLDPQVQQWAGQVQKALRDAARLVDTATATGKAIDAETLADARWRYDQGVLVGISINLSRPWHLCRARHKCHYAEKQIIPRSALKPLQCMASWHGSTA